MYILYVLSFFFFFFNIFIFYSVDIVDDNVNIVDEEPHFVGYSAINHYYYYYYYCLSMTFMERQTAKINSDFALLLIQEKKIGTNLLFTVIGNIFS